MRRRGFMGALLAAGSLPALGWAAAGNPAWLAAAREPDGTYALFGIARDGSDLFRIPLPDRGHAAAAHPTAPEAVAFARRPGTFALVIDCSLGTVLHRLDAPEGRHFYGHGTFVEGGRVLATTENDIATGEGRLGLWSRAEGYRRIGEIASGGVGPHDILTLPGDVLVIANGGILTDGREKLNLDTMRPNLSYATVGGGVEETVELAADLNRLSIRHLAHQDGTVAFAMQWEGEAADPVPLLGLHRRGRTPVLARAGLAEHMLMQGYAGSVAIAEGLVAITSPKGGLVHRFDLDGAFLDSHDRTDVCGVAPNDGGMVLSDGLGGLLTLDASGLAPLSKADRAWDNHMVRVPV